MPAFAPPPIVNLLTLPKAVYANDAIPSGNTITSTTDTSWASKLTIPANTLKVGSIINLRQSGGYTAGLTQTIYPMIRLGSTQIIPARAITGLLNAMNAPWLAVTTFTITTAGLVGGGILFLADDTTRIVFNDAPVTGIDYTQTMDLTASARWGAANNSITCRQFVAEVI